MNTKIVHETEARSNTNKYFRKPKFCRGCGCGNISTFLLYVLHIDGTTSSRYAWLCNNCGRTHEKHYTIKDKTMRREIENEQKLP